MRTPLATVCPWLLPLAGVCLMLVGLAPQSQQMRLNEADTTEEVQPHPACFNPAQRVQLRLAYRYYRRQCVRLSQARKPRELDACRAAVRESIGFYNQVAADTDPSAFDGTRLPRRLAISQ